MITSSHIYFIPGLLSYLSMVHGVHIPPGQKSYCRLTCIFNFTGYLWSSLLLLSMTFDRLYSIIRPHKAASFNTVKRAKITIVCIIIISVSYIIPHLFLAANVNWECVPYGGALGTVLGEIYYWLSFVIQLVIPFVLLLIMNSIIIHKIRTRSVFKKEGSSQGYPNSGEQSKIKSAEIQMFAILLSVTFAFLLLTTQSYIFFLYARLVDFSRTPDQFARYYIFYNFSHKSSISNHGINFFLYVISGRKFRSDLRNIFSFKRTEKKS